MGQKRNENWNILRRIKTKIYLHIRYIYVCKYEYTLCVYIK